VRPEPLEERRKRLARLLSRSNKALRDGIQLNEAMTGDGATIFRHACGLGLEAIVSKRMYFEWYYTPEFSTSLERACLQRPDYLVAGTRCVDFSAQAKAHTESARHKQSRQIRAAIKRWSLSGRTWRRRTVLLLCTAAIPA
jgi:hypothetical protein